MKCVRCHVVLPLLTLLTLTAACVTVNIYFPAATVEKTAEEIVDEVYQEGKEQPQSALPGYRESGSGFRWLPPRAAYAEEPTTVSNAAIRGLKDQIAERHRELLAHYRQGRVGIDRNGYLEVRDTSGLSLPQTASLKRLVEADNTARRQLYAEVARALDLQSDQVLQIQEIFSRQWRDKAEDGWWVETDAGAWRPK